MQNAIKQNQWTYAHGSLSLAPILLIGLTLWGQADDWPEWRGPNRAGISKEKGWLAQWPAEGPKQLWRAKVGVGYASMSVSKGHLYTMGNTAETDHVYCIDTDTGKEVWKHSYACSPDDPNGYPGPRCTPTVDDGRIYTFSRLGHMFCLDARDGKVVWSKNFLEAFAAKVPKWGFSGSPLVEGNLVVVEGGSADAGMVALDKTSGAVVWKRGNEGAGYSSLISYDHKGQRAVLAFSRNSLVARALKDGTDLWRYPWKTSYGVNAAIPIVAGDKVFVSSGYNFGCALLDISQNPTKEVWRNKNMRNHVSSSVLWQGKIYGFDENELKCLDFGSGEVLWTKTGFGKGSVLVADGKLIIYSERGKLSVGQASPEGYRAISTAQVLGGNSTWALPVLANGRIYCRSAQNLVCLDIKPAGPAAE